MRFTNFSCLEDVNLLMNEFYAKLDNQPVQVRILKLMNGVWLSSTYQMAL